MIVQRYYKYQENIPLIYSFYYEKYALKKNECDNYTLLHPKYVFCYCTLEFHLFKQILAKHFNITKSHIAKNKTKH